MDSPDREDTNRIALIAKQMEIDAWPRLGREINAPFDLSHNES
jgi:hypothetical protein